MKAHSGPIKARTSTWACYGPKTREINVFRVSFSRKKKSFPVSILPALFSSRQTLARALFRRVIESILDELIRVLQGSGLISAKVCIKDNSYRKKMKLKVVCRKVYDYVRYDLKEIAFPSSLPDPPHIKKRRKLIWKDRFYILKEASRLYGASWVRDIGPELRPNEYKKDEWGRDKPNGVKTTTKEKEPSTLEDLAIAARGGMETLRPALQRVYMTRASSYRDALKSFIQGYQEGIQQVMAGKEDSKSQQPKDPPKNPDDLLR